MKELPTVELSVRGNSGHLYNIKITIVIEYEKSEKLTVEKINELYEKGMPKIKDLINYKLREFVERYGEEYFTKTVGKEKLKDMMKTAIIGLKIIPCNISEIYFPEFTCK